MRIRRLDAGLLCAMVVQNINAKADLRTSLRNLLVQLTNPWHLSSLRDFFESPYKVNIFPQGSAATTPPTVLPQLKL